MEVVGLVEEVLAELDGVALPADLAQRRDLVTQLIFRQPYSEALASQEDAEFPALGVSMLADMEQTEAHPDWPVARFKQAAQNVMRRRREQMLSEIPQARQRFRALSYLIVFPDVDAYHARNGTVPWLDFDAIDFGALTRLYKAHLRDCPSVSLYSLDDYIDIGEAERARRGDVTELDRFGTLVLKPTLRVQDEVVRVRDRWSPLHGLHPREGRIPPPAFLGIVSEHYNYDGWINWERYITSGLFETRRDPIGALFTSTPKRPPRSKLTPQVQSGLEEIFGLPFSDSVGFMRLQHSRVPHWLGGDCGDSSPFASLRDHAKAG